MSNQTSRRVSDAISWLTKHHFVKVESRKGRPPIVTLRNEAGISGTTSAYQPPGEVYDALNTAASESDDLVSEETKRLHRYIRIPAGLWMNGWIAILSGPAIAMLLVLLANYDERQPNRALWFSPSVGTSRYDLSEDTRSDGLIELEHYGLVTLKRQPVNRDVFDFRRMRNTYVLNLGALNAVSSPASPL